MTTSGMRPRHTGHLVVMDGETLLGVVSMGDVVKDVIDDQQFTIEQLEHYITGTA